MPGNIPTETGKIEFVDSGQINVPESIDTKGAPLPEEKVDAECFCTKEFTVDEIKNFVKAMRDSEKIKTSLLFSEENCPLKKDDTTYDRLCVEINATMKKYNIKTCIRKIHFLAQTYHESSRYGTVIFP